MTHFLELDEVRHNPHAHPMISRKPKKNQQRRIAFSLI